MPAITKPNQHFDATLYTGTGSNGLAVTNGGFQPDLIWLKSRNNTYYHNLLDSVRGAGVRLFSNLTDAESDNDCQSSFDSNGFTLNADAGGVNNSTTTYVAWQWKGGGTAVSNTSGTITSSVSANPTAGFSVVTYTGTGANATVGHGLGVAPQMIIVKCRSNASTNFTVYHTSIGNTGYIYLNLTNVAVTGYSGFWNNTSPTSSVFSLGSDVDGYVNGSGRTNVAYCFAPIAGYSAFGSYVANASADGPFIYTGFRPRWIMLKRSSAAGAPWSMIDTSRSSFNAAKAELDANTSDAEATAGNGMDILSNGFKLRDSGAFNSASGATFIYAAFAEAPFKYANAR